MSIPNIEFNESLLDYSIRLSDYYSSSVDYKYRKNLGQIFTPKNISVYMSRLFFEISRSKLRILDPCAGVGTLIAALIDTKILKIQTVKEISVDLYELDINLKPYLEAVMRECTKKLNKVGISFSYRIYLTDFIIEKTLNTSKSVDIVDKSSTYNLIIMNPPYLKLSKKSTYWKKLKNIIYGKPNLYPLFIGICSSLLDIDGELVFISPRSFCSGIYYKKIRDYLLDNIQIKNIHLFNSRSVFFDKVLQETIIMKVINSKSNHCDTIISTSNDDSFSITNKFVVSESDIIFKKNNSRTIIIPTINSDLEIVKTINQLSDSLISLKIIARVGSVVPFRNKEYIIYESNEKKYPLLWMDSIETDSFNVKWPNEKNREKYILANCASKNLLNPVKNYVMIRRFSSKEQEKRIISSVFLKENFPNMENIGIENHIIFFDGINRNISKKLAFGLVGYLRMKIVDIYFRTLNGNTQVNKYELVNFPFPNKTILDEIGEYILNNKISKINKNIEHEINQIIGIDCKFLDRLYG